MSKAERASLDKYRDRDLHVSGGRLTRPLAMSSGRNGASSVEVLFFHCSDGYDLIVDREGRELRESDLLWTALDAAARLRPDL